MLNKTVCAIDLRQREGAKESVDGITSAVVRMSNLSSDQAVGG